jgi:hypothetical protein
LTGTSAFGGGRVATARLVHFDYPLEALQDLRDEVEDEILKEAVVIGDFIVFETLIARKPRIQVARVIRIFEVGDQLEVLPYLVPAGDRYGPWTRRPWHPEEEKVIIARPEVLCVISLQERALTAGSLEKLAACGVNIDSHNRDQKALPARTV